jgi:putative protease
MADPGLIMMVREKWPEVPIHLSVQANTGQLRMAVKFWQRWAWRASSCRAS